MSNEQIEEAEEELQDEQTAYDNADKDFGEAVKWRNLRWNKLVEAKDKLKHLKEKDL